LGGIQLTNSFSVEKEMGNGKWMVYEAKTPQESECFVIVVERQRA
jgi:hypothetical protein